MFMTTSNSIGASSISQETLPLVYYPKSNKFSKVRKRRRRWL